MNILITGGSSGVGEAIVRTLAAAGYNITFTYSSSVAKAEELEATFPNTKAMHCNFTDPASVAAFLEKIPALDLDVLVNNANGPINKNHFYKADPNQILTSFEHNVLQPMRITQEAIKTFRKKKFGKIINIISAYVVNKPALGYSEYTANKAYMLSMSKAWANECIKFNTTSNSISPSFMLTKITADTDERVIETITDAHPLRRLLVPMEVAHAVKFYVEASQHVNGTNLIMNAGIDIV